MKTSVIGFPRIGEMRELKFAAEKFFRGEINEEELKKVGAELRKKHLLEQKNAGIDFIPVNDFSYYDCLLDTAYITGMIPERYKKLGVSELSTYFAMARGYQGKEGDVKALPMKKWYNTNYHYIVPEVDDSVEIRLLGNKIFDEFEEALALGIKTKPVIAGPYTLLSLARFTGTKQKEDIKDDLVAVYQEIFNKLESLGAEWIQVDEPSLVRDMSLEDIAFFENIYTEIFKGIKNVKLLLQTYFGDVRDIYPRLAKLPFAGLGLDFLEGKETKNLVEKYGFPKDKQLFAGLVNGKNIWKNNYAKTLNVVRELKEKGINVVLSSSCSLLHVPYTLDNEKKLSEKYKEYFAFAREKLVEIAELGKLADDNNYDCTKEFVKNQILFNKQRDCVDEKVRERLAAVTEKDFNRNVDRKERAAIQRDRFKLPLFPTTTIGSFPQTADVKKNRSAFRKGEISEADYKEFNKKKIERIIRFQEEIGLDVLVHGEYERNDMVEYFGEALDGYLFTEYAWVQSYGTRCLKPPIIWGDVSRRRPITVEWSVYAQSLTDKPVKGMLTGPVTIFNWSFPREDISIKESMNQIALAIRDEVLDLEKNGISIIQIDEAALREKLPLRKSDWYSEYLDFAIPAFRLTASGVRPETQIHTHMCYSEFTDIIPAIDNMDADVITFEASRSDLQILDSLKENNFQTQVGPGVYDIHSPRVPSVEEITDALGKMRERIADENLWVNPDCGLKTRGEEETKASLINLVKAAHIIGER